jgi:hypothetical protein
MDFCRFFSPQCAQRLTQSCYRTGLTDYFRVFYHKEHKEHKVFTAPSCFRAFAFYHKEHKEHKVFTALSRLRAFAFLPQRAQRTQSFYCAFVLSRLRFFTTKSTKNTKFLLRFAFVHSLFNHKGHKEHKVFTALRFRAFAPSCFRALNFKTTVS